MSRPGFPQGCVMNSAMISAIQAEQREYDQDPEAYERRLREQKDECFLDAMRKEAERVRELNEYWLPKEEQEEEEGAFFEDGEME